jgi:transposase
MSISFLLPGNLSLKARGVSCEGTALIIHATACKKGAICPLCKGRCKRVHSKYTRIFSDLPVAGYLVQIRLEARKFFCDNSGCSRKIFTERFQQEIEPYSRRSFRSDQLLARIALELGGNTGSKISAYVGLPASPSTILRLLKGLKTEDKISTSGIIGVDDWAFKKGRNYGTVIVDLTTREIIDLLPDREASTLTLWLKEHPEIEIVSRDRYGPYALAAKEGAPQAQQVADRFHLCMNLGKAMKGVLQKHGKALKQAFNAYSAPTIAHAVQQETAEREECKPIERINVKRQYKFEKVKELHLAGYSVRAISKSLNISRQTIRTYLSQDKIAPKESYRSTNFDDFLQYLLHPDNRGKTYRLLHQEIVQMGFTGKYTQFCNRMGQSPQLSLSQNSSRPKPVHIKTWSTTRISILLYMDKQEIKKQDDRAFLELLYQQCPPIKQMEILAKKFKQLFQDKTEGTLKAWIDEATQPESTLKHFAANLDKDFHAVNNAVIMPYSNGQVEGQVNRIKNIKRRMYGRASFHLLRKMILLKQ